MSNQLVDAGREIIVKEAEYSKCFQITKSNDFIRDSRVNLTITEQRIVYYLISTIAPNDTCFKEKVFDIDVFCEMCDLQKKGSLEHIKSVLKRLRDKSVWIDTPDGRHITFSWFSCVEINDNTNKITLEISDRMRPYLLELKSNFTTLKLGDVIKFKKKYTSWIYENLKLNMGLNKKRKDIWEIEVDELRIKCSYLSGNFKDVRRRIIDPAVKEINDYTSLKIHYVVTKKGNKVNTVIFRLGLKEEDNDIIEVEVKQ